MNKLTYIVYNANSQYYVMNTASGYIQSSWSNKVNALQTAKDLNKRGIK
jgi:hypothetical protein